MSKRLAPGEVERAAPGRPCRGCGCSSALLTRPARKISGTLVCDRAAGQPLDDEAAEAGGEREAEQVADGRAGEARPSPAAPPGEDRQPGRPDDEVEQHREEAAPRARARRRRAARRRSAA